MADNNQGVIKMTTKVQKWGNSLAVRIPSEVINHFNIEQGSEIEIKVVENEIKLIPKKQKPKLEELMAKITEDNQHDEIDFGKPEGKEVW